MADSVEMTVKFDGQTPQMDLDTLIGSLMSLAALPRGVAAVVVKDAPVEVRVNAPRPGSFQMDLELLKVSLP